MPEPTDGSSRWHYDLNPVPPEIRPRVVPGPRAGRVVPYFELEPSEARAIAAEVGKAVSNWRARAGRHGIRDAEIGRMASAFEHDDLKQALA